MNTDSRDTLNLWDRLDTIWMEIAPIDLEIMREMAKNKLRSELKKFAELSKYSHETVEELDAFDKAYQRIIFLRQIMNTRELPVSKNKSNYKD